MIVDDNFHANGDEPQRHQEGVYDTLAEAVTACHRLIDRDLAGHYRDGMTAQQLYDLYISFGEDPFIIEIGDSGPAGSPPFSGWTYAKERSEEIAGKPTI